MQWCTLSPVPCQRMNISPGAPVSTEYLQGLEVHGKATFEDFLAHVSESIRDDLCMLALKNDLCKNPVYILFGLVRHHLRRGRPHHFHHERWWFVVLDRKLLVPLWRHSDGPDPPWWQCVPDAAEISSLLRTP